MPLMTTKPMFDLAYSGGFAVGAFNVNNMEITQGIIEACAAEKSPLILQISKGARKYANMRYLKHMIDAAVGEVEHRLGGHERHKSSSFQSHISSVNRRERVVELRVFVMKAPSWR